MRSTRASRARWSTACPDGDEPVAVVQDLAADLARELRSTEPALVDAVLTAVVQATPLPILRARLRPLRRVDDDELGGHAARLGEEALRFLAGQQVAVEVTGDQPLERAVGERQRYGLALHGVEPARGGDLD